MAKSAGEEAQEGGAARRALDYIIPAGPYGRSRNRIGGVGARSGKKNSEA